MELFMELTPNRALVWLLLKGYSTSTCGATPLVEVKRVLHLLLWSNFSSGDETFCKMFGKKQLQ
jgi:hypothetical protein